MILTRDRHNKSITISQPGYTDEMLDTYDIPLVITSYPLTPMSDAPRGLPSDTNKLLDKKGIEDYQSKIGSLLYMQLICLPIIQNHQHKTMLLPSTGFSYTWQVHHILVLHYTQVNVLF
jgi:hypothetical protein